MPKMSGSEAMLEALRVEGVSLIPGVVGSGFMDALDIFPQAGIRFMGVRHEQTAAHMADAYARVSGRASACIAQNGPGVTNLLTGIATAYHAHSPVIVITPSVTSATAGTDGFQETDQLAAFAKVTKYQLQVNRPKRMVEAFQAAFRMAYLERGPVQVDIPRDFFYGVFEAEIAPPHRYRPLHPLQASMEVLGTAADRLNRAHFPVIVSGMGVVDADATAEVAELAEYLTAPVVTSYMHNDAFPKSHRLWAGPIGYQGSKAAMNLLSRADVVLGMGTRFGLFGTLPAYDMDYFPKSAQIIQVNIDGREIGRQRPIDIGVMGDARQVAAGLLRRLREVDSKRPVEERLREIDEEKRRWQEQLMELSGSEEVPIKPRRALADIARALPAEAIVVADVGNVASVASAYLGFDEPRSFIASGSYAGCGFGYGAALGAKLARPDRPVVALIGDGSWTMLGMAEVLTAVRHDIPVVAIINNNLQWGAEKKNQVDYYDNRFIGTNLTEPDFAEIARLMGAFACAVEKPGDVEFAVRDAFEAGRPAVIEVRLSRELGEPFRRDALRTPVRYLPRYRNPGSIELE